MRVTHRRRRVVAAVVVAVLVAALAVACTLSEAAPAGVPAAREPSAAPAPEPVVPATREPVRLTTRAGRQSPGPVAYGTGDAPYNYAPSVLWDGGRYRMWWCSQLGIANPPGDDILLAESGSMDGPFLGPDGRGGTPVFSGSVARFDAMHTCDPSVLKVDGTYYLYYTGAAGDHAHGNAIGLATSRDGRVWTRANGGRPLVTAARDVKRDNTYGAGQPSVIYLAGLFYLMFTDTTGQDSGHNGAGQFVLRSPDPAFGRDVAALGRDGFQPVQDTSARLRSVVDAFSADWMWVDALATFAIAHETRDGTTITFWDWGFRSQGYEPLLLPGPWREGPGLVRRADGHAVVSLDDPCGTVAIDLVRATHEAAAGPSGLRHFGLDVTGFDACAEPGRAVLALDGFAVPSPSRTVDLIVGGQIVRFDRRSVAEKLAVRILARRPEALAGVEVAAHVKPGTPVLRAPGRGIGFLLDDRLWRISSAEAAALNSSAVGDTTPQEWDGYERGLDLVGPPR
ncbi:MAG: beta-xylosidase [Actinophytocola sp.]|uniref:beta-xylosidase n=1 Tax=Actinophytocola sp. TaxID=1872138 RepID=UPI003C726B91